MKIFNEYIDSFKILLHEQFLINISKLLSISLGLLDDFFKYFAQLEEELSWQTDDISEERVLIKYAYFIHNFIRVNFDNRLNY